MPIQTNNVDDLLARLGLAKRSTPDIVAVPAPVPLAAPPASISTVNEEAPATSQSPTAIPSNSPHHSDDSRRKESELRLAETMQRLKKGPVEARSPEAVVPVAPAGVPGPLPVATVPNRPVKNIMTPPQPIHGHRSGIAMKDRFWPRAPRNLQEAGITDSELNSLILKYLYHRGTEAGSRIAQQTGLRFPVIDITLRQLKADKLVVYKSSLTGGDYQYELTDLGRDRARHLNDMCTYFGTAPVTLQQYVASVKAQTITGLKPSLSAIRKALADLDINDELLSSIGQAIHSGRGMFLFGAPGNGKTSIAERVTKSFGDTIWIPKCISAAGEIIRLYDPNRHKQVPLEDGSISADVDGRWVLIERPTIVVGGELRMENLEITVIRDTGIGEAPLQLKANCGTLLIDDFGRQTMPVDQLLNRWIIPLEQRHDFLQLESGRSIQVPFDELIIFSTNLEPRDLVDDAFLRRIPYKIEVKNPTKEEFRELMIMLAQKLGFECEPGAVDYLIENHYLPVNRPFRFCQPRDLLRQVENFCTLHELPKHVTCQSLDQAVANYFSIM